MLKFILSSKFQINKTSLFSLANNFKMFARKEINKTSLLENFHNLNKIEHKSQNVQANENLNFKITKEIFSNNSPMRFEDVKNLLDKNLFNLKSEDTPQTKFLVSIKKNINDHKLLENPKFLDGLNEIALNYSQNNSNFYESTVFKFLVLIDQILTKRSLADYQQANVTHFAYSHLINYFGQNFFTIFEKNPENLLNYNFLYFMTINKGEFSECLKVLIEKFPNKQNLYKLLSTQFVIKREDIHMEKIHNKDYFDSIEKNVTTPSSDLIKDFTFKYNDKNLKIKLINENVREKQDYEKIRLVYNNLIKFKNSNEAINSTFLKDLEMYLNTFFPHLGNDLSHVFSEDFIQIKLTIDNFNKYLRSKLSLLTKIPINNKFIDSVSFLNIHEVFNPLFSGENDLSSQFTVVSEHFGNLYALELLYKYLDSQNEGEVFSFNELYQLDLILIPFRFTSWEAVFDSVRFLSDKSKILKEIQLNLKTNSKYKIGKLFVADKSEKKSKKLEETRGNSEKSPKQSNFKDDRQVSERSNLKETVSNPPKKQKMVYNNPQEKKENLNIKKIEPNKENTGGEMASKFEVDKEKPTLVKKRENKPIDEVKKEETHLTEIKSEESIPVEMKNNNTIPVEIKNENSIPVEMINENTIPTEMIHETIKVEVETKFSSQDNQTTPTTQLTNTETQSETTKKKSVFVKNEENTESKTLNISEDSHDIMNKNKNKITVNYDRESAHKNPFYKTNRRGFSASIDKVDNRTEEIVKPLGKIYKEIKATQQKERSDAKQTKEVDDKQEPKKQKRQPDNTENKNIFTKSVDKTQKSEFVATPKKSQEKIETTSAKKQQQFIVPPKQPQDQLAKTKEEKTTPTIKKYRPTLKIFEPIKYQQTKPQFVSESEKSANELKELSIPKNTLLGNLEKLSIEMKQQDDSLYNTYLKQNRDNIDTKLAQTKFDLNYWTDKIFDENFEEMEAQEIEKHIYTKISKVLRKYISNRDKLLMVIYSLTNPALKDEVVLDLEYCFYQIFTNSPPESFDMNLGHIGYQTLLNNNLLDTSIKNRENLEKIIYHMEKNYYLPNNENIRTILQICDKNFYPKYLKNLIDNYVINKNILLDIENFTYYIQIITNFEDFSQYYQNLINSSYTDFKIPVRAEFFEYLIYKYLTKMDFEKIKSILRNLNQRYISEYKEEDERLEAIYSGNNLILYTIIQFVENAKERENQKVSHSDESNQKFSIHEIRKNSKHFIEIVNNIIAQNQSFNKSWMEDHEFTFLLMRLYKELCFNYKEYFTILDNLMSRNQVETIFDPKKIYDELSEILKFNVSKLKPDEHRLAIEVFERFLETYVRSGAIELSFEDKFEVVRHENLYRFFRFFRNSKDEDEEKANNMQLFIKFMDTVLDPLTYLRLHKIDKVNLEKVLFKVFNNNKNKVLEYIYKLDARRKLNDAKLDKNAEVNKFADEVEEEIIEKYSLMDIEDDSLSFKEN